MWKEHANRRLKLAHHRIIARALARPGRRGDLLDEALAVVDAWNRCAFRPSYVRRWERLLDAPADVLAREIVHMGAPSDHLRGSSPFALTPTHGLSTDQVRRLWRIAAGRAIRILRPEEYWQYAEHLKSLPPEDRKRRFWAAVDDAWIDRYVGDIDADSAVIGHYDKDLVLDGAIMVGLVHRDSSHFGEIGVTVLPRARHGGIGFHLLERAILWARNHEADRLFTVCLSTNRDMIHLAKAHQMALERVDDGTEAVIAIRPGSETTVSLELLENQIGEWDYVTKAHDTAFAFAAGHALGGTDRDVELARLTKIAAYGRTDVVATYLIVLRYVLLQAGLSVDDQALFLADVRTHLEPLVEHRPHLRTFIAGLPEKVAVTRTVVGFG